jgi:SAM-dependent methyltransferase
MSDKSPHNIIAHFHKHPYTPIYSLLLGPLRNKPITFCEIGIAGGYSIKMWRNYFCKETTIVAMDYDPNLVAYIEMCKIPNVITSLINVKDENVIESSFSTLGLIYDIILDDSDHEFDSHILLVKKATQFLKPGGILLIEDIYRRNTAQMYETALEGLLAPFESVYYIKAEHKNRFSGDWNNDGILAFIKA